MDLLLPILFLTGAGVLIAFVLTVADKALAVAVDETVANIVECLPGISCGACGFSGCGGYAEAVASGAAKPNLCKPGGADAAAKIGEILGISVDAAEKQVAFVACKGSIGIAADKYDYVGSPSCHAAVRYYGGAKQCAFGCAGFGDCTAVCPNNAITVVNGAAVVNTARCNGCGMCAKMCPQKIVFVRPLSAKTLVACSSTATGKDTRAACKTGCIACRQCEKKCPEKAVKIENNKAVIDHKLCKNCGVCVATCPTKAITA
ncbi:MAG: RnfABCDGE type electron transport complex subunit B [Oscillospiraceae bacterium]|nr:RnfABCDGE type electron transport complex subunit B [Oscillospiraceae bacterium]